MVFWIKKVVQYILGKMKERHTKKKKRNISIRSGKRLTFIRKRKWRILWHIKKYIDMKRKFKTELRQKNKENNYNQICRRNQFKEINTWAFSPPILNYVIEELRNKEHRTRKLMRLHKILYEKDVKNMLLEMKIVDATTQGILQHATYDGTCDTLF